MALEAASGIDLVAQRAIPPGHCAAYYQLPEAIQFGLSYEQWLWLSDDEKARVTLTQTEPEDDRYE